MLKDITVTAPAKINLGLRVLPKRQDGFHDIESIFSTVGIYDELAVKIVDGKSRCTVRCDAMQLGSDNTINTAYTAFEALVGEELPCVDVTIHKRIPSGGGLGGGSSDAAFFIKALNELCKSGLSYEQMRSIAAKVGSDVFFFLSCDESGHGAAVVTGRGECVKSIPMRNDLYYLLVFPGVHSSTKEAYALVDEFYESGKKMEYPVLEDLVRIYNGPVKDWSFVNTFTGVIARKYSIIGQALSDLRESGALYTDMSGSGSTVFGVFASKEDALSAKKKLSGSWNVFACY
ncbi:4-(cytidine 5'-diphospho)-2-C-methyl-D-erythritol kinase [Treponema sp.]|uniref:4-(cytidine 5'-diphospho)-2-C-methyl-D-erythritol kinase n=1 Tax=Treponema sp. TaxID=166 RepID=UPI00298E59C8|nr:4-(cytidine 5'-diphospho)-2-C-methyl-D-erythritol kinase [Treponema sp.]MCR5613084.1 4-(cytidine 5'-diphospho)-2-C-methyl-D-erythritol kinase [Treponema sp.]